MRGYGGRDRRGREGCTVAKRSGREGCTVVDHRDETQITGRRGRDCHTIADQRDEAPDVRRTQVKGE